MFVMPFSVGAGQFSVMVVIEAGNIERLKANDPAEVSIAKLGPPWIDLMLKDVLIVMPTPEDAARAMAMATSGNGPAALRFLSRGFAYRPDKGDNDKPYETIADSEQFKP